jgi:integrase
MSKETFLSPLASQIKRFIGFKRAAGCCYDTEEVQLRGFDRFLRSHLDPDSPVITDALSRTYMALIAKNSVDRLSVLRRFCRFLALEEPRTFIPPRGFLGIRKKLFVPRVLTRNEARRFVRACLCLHTVARSPLRGMVQGTIFLLLYLTGMRVGEALGLNQEDVDLANGVIRIRKGKFGKSRLVPVAQDLNERMKDCRLSVEGSFGARPPDACFFPGPKGSRYSRHTLWPSFRKVLAQADIARVSAGKGLRLHDLRHGFAVHRMMLWYEQGADLGAKLPILATYLGHVGLSSSQYYLRLTEDLVGGILSRYQARFGHLIEERRTT